MSSSSPEMCSPDATHPRFLEPPLQVDGLKIALVQMPVGMDKKKNISEAVRFIKEEAEKGAQLIALPECFNSPYGTTHFGEYCEDVPNGPTCAAISAAAKASNVCVVAGTLPEKSLGKLYNTCTVWSEQGDLLAMHRKMHLFDIDIPNKIKFKESETLTAGDKVTTFEYRGVKIGIGICYDLRFPELAHFMSEEGCSLLIYPSAFNMTTGPAHWELLARARALDNQLWVALVSPARDTKADYVAWGHSLLVSPWGEVRGQLSEGPGVLHKPINVEMVEEVRTQIPIRSQRRIDLYDVIKKK